MSHYVTADLHGCYDAFLDLLEKIDFSADDMLYIIGDVIDRGDHGVELLQYIMNTPNIRLLLGNHELMMAEALACGDHELWFYNGGMVTYKAFLRLSEEEQTKIREYLDTLAVFLDIRVKGRTFRLIHGRPMADESDITAGVWERPVPDDVFFSDRTVIVGHTPTMFYGDDRHILHGKNVIFIDCGYIYNGLLGCIRLEDMKEFYID